MKRIISFIMSIVMIFSMLPMEALAATADHSAWQLGDTMWVKEDESPVTELEEGLTWIDTQETELRNELTCQLTAHVHEENCPVDEDGNFTCGGHIHTEDCMGKVYACEEHTHDDSCKNSGYICGMDVHIHDEACEECALEEHDHTAECVDDSYICGMEAHTHGEDCAYTEELVCGQAEHTHATDGCGAAGDYTCGLEAHDHGDSCYTPVTYVKWEVAALETEEVEAEEAAAAGVLTEGISWEIANGTLSISGEGEMPDYTEGTAPWYSDRASINIIKVGEGVTAIGEYAFYGFENVYQVNLPDSLTAIGSWAFGNGDAYEGGYTYSIIIPAGVSIIEPYAFAGNINISQISVDDGNSVYKSLDSSNNTDVILASKDGTVIYACPASIMESLNVVPDGVVEIAEGAFYGSVNLYSLELPESLEVIGEDAFRYCKNLRQVIIPFAETLGKNAFNGCELLSNITIGGVSEIGNGAFANCSALKDIRFTANPPTIEADSFANVVAKAYYPESNDAWADAEPGNYGGTLSWTPYDKAMDWTVENGVLTISGTGAMYDYTGMGAPWTGSKDEITSIVIGDKITAIGRYAFAGLDKVSSVTLGSSLEEIRYSAFMNCSALTTVTVPASVTFVDQEVFSATGLMEILVEEENESYVSVDGVLFTADMALLSSYPTAKADSAYTIPYGVEEIEGCAFIFSENLETVTFPQTVHKIENMAFSFSKALKEVYFQGDPPLSNPYGLYGFESEVPMTFYYPSGNTAWEYVLEEYSGMNWQPYTVTNNSCGDNATWKIENGVLTISGTGAVNGYNPFDEDTSNDAPWASQADSITKVVVEEGITKMGNHALTYLSSAESYELPSTLTDLDFGNFTGTSSLTVVTIPDSNPAYKAVNNLVIERESETLIAVPAGLTGSIVVPDGVTAIRSDAFALCHDQAVHLPNSLNEIQDGAFVQAKNMSLYFYVAPPETLGEEMFMMADGITVRYPYIEPWYQNAETLMVNYGGTNITWESATSGATGENVFWEIKDGVLTFSVQDSTQIGKIGGYMASEGHYSPWYVHRDSITAIEIGEGITEIGFFAFDGLENVKTVSFPASFTAPQNLGYGCFAGLTGLESFIVAEGNTAFSAMNGALVLTVTGAGGTEKVMFRAPTTASFTIPEGLNVITQFSMAGSKLTSLQIPESVYLIEPNAFAGSTSLTSVTIAGEPNILDDAFAGCSALTDIKFLGNAPEFSAPRTEGENVFVGTFNGVSNITVTYPGGDSTWTDIVGENYGGSNITWYAEVPPVCGDNATWAIENGVLTISGTGAVPSYNHHPNWYNPTPWYDVRDTITAVVVEEGITELGDNVLENLENAVSFSFPSTLTEISYTNFSGCTSLETITVASGNPTFRVEMDLLLKEDGDVLSLVAIPRSGMDFAEIPYGVTNIESGSAEGCHDLRIIVPNTVQQISVGGFAGLKDSQIEFIGTPPAFMSIDMLAEAENIEICYPYIEPWYLEDPNLIGSSFAGTNVTWKSAKYGTTGEDVRWVLYDNGKLTFTVFEIADTGKIGGYMASQQHYAPWYEHRESITSIEVEEGITHIGFMAFDGLTNVKTVSLPASFASTDSVGYLALAGLTGVEEFIVDEDNTLFSSMNGALVMTVTGQGGTEKVMFRAPTTADFVIPEGVNVITQSAMAHSQAASITVPGSVYLIEPNAFAGCKALTDVVIKGEATILDAAFVGCSALTDIKFLGNAPEFSAPRTEGENVFVGTFNGVSNITVSYPGGDSTWTNIVGKPYGGSNITWKAVYEGSCGDNVNWNIKDGVLTIYGNGAVEDYWQELGPWYASRDHITSVVVEEGVTRLGRRALDGLYKVTSISLPASLTEVEMLAFSNTDSLKSITVAEGNSVLRAENNALLMSFTNKNTGEPGVCLVRGPVAATGTWYVPDGVTVIGYGAMAGSKASAIMLPGTVRVIEAEAFGCAPNLTKMTFPVSVEVLDTNLFMGCNKLTSLTFEGNPPVIQDYSFEGLKTITINYPATKPWTSFQKQSYGAAKATWKVITSGQCGPNTNWSVASGVLTISGTGYIDYPYEVVDDEAVYEGFAPWFGLKDSITSIVVKEGITSLGAGLFAGLDKVTTISLPKSLEACYQDFTANMPKLKTFKVASGGKYKVSGGALLHVDDFGDYVQTTLVRAPVDVTGTYTIPAGVTRIGFGALDGIKASQILIPDSVGEIESWVFTDCPNLTELTIPASVYSIYGFTFVGTGLKNLYFEGAPLISWGDQFQGLDGLNVYHSMDPAWDAVAGQPYGGENISWYRNANPENTVHWTVENGVLRFYGSGAIYGFMPEEGHPSPWSARADEIYEIVVEEGITGLGFNAFHGLTRAFSVRLPQSLTEIGFQALADCVNVSEYTFPNGNMIYRVENNAIIQNRDNVLVRGPSGFSGGTYYVPYGVEVVGYGAFIGGQASGLMLPDTVTFIEPQAFACMSNLHDIVIPAGVTAILDDAFYGSSVKSVHFLGEAAELSDARTEGENVYTGTFHGLNNVTVFYNAHESWDEIAGKNYGGSNIAWEIGGSVDSIRWSVVDGMLTVFGEGEVPSFSDEDAPWHGMEDTITAILVEEGITGLGDGVFQQLDKVKTIALPATLQQLGQRVFSGCTALEAVSFPNGNTRFSVENGILSRSGMLYLIPAASSGVFTVPDGVKYILACALEGCKDITLNAHYGVKYINEDAFLNTENLTLVFSGDAPYSIDENAFRGATGAAIGYPGTASGWTNLIGQIFGGEEIRWYVADIDEDARCGDTSWYTLSEDGTLTIHGTGVVTTNSWQDHADSITAIVVEEDITAIGEAVFQSLDHVAVIQLPYTLVELDPVNFINWGTTALRFEFPNGSKVFESPNGHDLYYCPGKTLVKVLPKELTLEDNTYDVPGNVRSIGQYAFVGYNGTTVAVSSSVQNMEPYAFADSSNLVAVYLTNSAIGEISDHAFSGSNNLEIVAFNEQLAHIGDYAFAGCTRFSSTGSFIDGLPYEATVLMSVGHIGEYAFSGCESLDTLLLSDSIWYLGEGFISGSGVQRVIFAGGRPEEMSDLAFTGAADLSVYYDPWCTDSWNEDTKLSYRAVDETNTTTWYNGFSLEDADIHWTLESGVLTITGTGELTTLDLLGVQYDVMEVVVEDGITSVGENILKDLPNLHKITLAESVTSFHISNLHDLPVLEEVDFGGVTGLTVEDNLILQGSTLAATLNDGSPILEIPASVTRISTGALSSRHDVVEIVIHTTADMVIEEAAFADLWNLELLVFTGNAPQFDADAFDECDVVALYPYGDTSWNSVVEEGYGQYWTASGYINENFLWYHDVREDGSQLGFFGFGDMPDFSSPDEVPWKDLNYTSVYIVDTITSIGDYAFYGSKLDYFEIPDSVTSIGDYAFANCFALSSMAIPNSVTSIGDYAFYHCYDLSYAPMPTSLISVGAHAFDDCDLFSVTLGDTVQTVGKQAFNSNSRLYFINIPATAQIDRSAFDYCYDLEKVTITPGSGDEQGRMRDYTEAELPFWTSNNVRFVTLAHGVTYAGEYAFAKGSFHSVDLGNVQEIGSRAFAMCSVETLKLPDTLTTIGEGAFFKVSPLRSITIPDSVTTIGDAVFAQSSLVSVKLPEGLTEIPTNTFNGCENLETVEIPDSVHTIGILAFADTGSLYGLNLPEGLTTIEGGAFRKSIINNLNLPDTVVTIGEDAFQYCANLSVVTIPASVRTIQQNAFEGSGLDYLIIRSHDLTIEDRAFANTVMYGVYFNGSRGQWESGITLGEHTGIDPDSDQMIWNSDYKAVEKVHILDTNGKFGKKGEILDGKTYTVDLNKTSSLTFTNQALPAGAAFSNILWTYGSVINYQDEYHEGPLGKWNISGNKLTLTNLVPGEMTLSIQNRPNYGDDPNSDRYTWATADIRLIFKRPVQKIAITGDYSGYLINNSGTELKANITPANATNQNLQWSVENVTGEAIIDSYGFIISTKPGTVIVRANAIDGSGVVAEKQLEIVDYALEITSPETLTSGKSMALKANFVPANLTKTSILWDLWVPEGYENLITLKGTTLTAKAGLTEPVYVEVYAYTKDGRTSGWQGITVYPAATQVMIESGNTDTTGKERSTINLDVNDPNVTEFRAHAYTLPDKANQDVKWTFSDTKYAFAENYEIVDNEICVSGFTGKTGKVTLTATATDGTGKKATLTLNFIKLPTNVQIMRSGAAEPVGDDETIELMNGTSLTLTTDIAKDKTLTNKTVIWEVDPNFASYVTITSAGKLTVRNVSTQIEDVTVRAKVNAAPYSDFEPWYVEDTVQLRLYPVTQQVNIVREGEVLADKAKITMNLFDGDMDLEAEHRPFDANLVGTWTSSNKKVATIDAETGLVTAVAPGSTTIKYTAADGSKKATQITLTVVKLADTVELTGKKAADFDAAMNNGLRGGKYVDLVANVLAQDGTAPANKKVTWTTSDAAVAAVSTSGRVTAKTVSRNTWVTITATAADGSGAESSVDILIRPKNAETLTINHGSQDITGKTITVDLNEVDRMIPSLWAYVSDPASENDDQMVFISNEATWTSSNAKIAEHLGGGQFKLLKAGNVTITAKYGKTSLKFTLKIVNLMTGLDLTSAGNATEVRSGKTLQLTATPWNVPTNKKVTWTSSDPTVAAVASNGKVTAKTVMENTWVTITATAQDGSGVQNSMDLLVKPAKDQTFHLVWGDTDDYAINVVDGKTTNTYIWFDNHASLIQLRPMIYDAATGTWEEVAATVTYSNAKNVSTNQTEGTDWLADTEYFLNTVGTYTFTAKYNGSTVKTTVKMSELVNGLEIGKTGNHYMTAGSSLQLTANILNKAANKTVTWTTSNPDVATVAANGKVTAKKILEAQTVTITATAKDASLGYLGDRQAEASMELMVYPAATAVEILEANLDQPITNLTIVQDLAHTNTYSVRALVHPYDLRDFAHQFGADQGVTWKSSSNAIAKCDEYGNITLLKEGTVTITATANDGSKKNANFKLQVVHSLPNVELLNQVNSSDELEIKGGTKLTLKLRADTFDTFPTAKVSFKLNDYGAKCGATISAAGVITTKSVKQPTPVDVIITEKANPENQWTYKLLITP